MPPRKATSAPQQKQPSQNAARPKSSNTSATTGNKAAIPEHEIKQSSSMSAQLALQAARKAYDLRQAAYGAGDPNAREEILAKAINKEVEAESFGKAAKYTRSGAFQGLAAGAGLGVQPGVTLGKLTGALVGGVAASVGALLGGGVGSAYGAISGPFWNLGEIASQGVRSIVGDFPNWEATSSQKQALEKMVMGAQQTKAPSQDELQQMSEDNGGASEMDYQQFAQDCYAWLPSMPSMPSKSSLPSMPSMSSIPGLGGWSQAKAPPPTANKTAAATVPTQNKQPKASSSRTAPSTATPQESTRVQQQTTPAKPKATSKPPDTPAKATSQPTKPQQPQKATEPQRASQKADEKAVKKRPKKLEIRSTSTTSQPQSEAPAPRRKPPKLAPRQKPATASK